MHREAQLSLVGRGRGVVPVDATVRDDDGLHGAVVGALGGALDHAEHLVQALHHAPEHHVLAVQVRRGARGDEELSKQQQSANRHN